MILVDSDVMIAHLRGRDPARIWLRSARVQGPLSISVVSVAEVTGGMRSAERREVWSLLSAMRIEPVTELIARQAGVFMRQYRRNHSSIGIADYLIAATAQHRQAALATLNVRHFPMFPGIEPPFPLP